MSDNHILYIPGGIIGFVGEEPCVLLAYRNNGDEALFASRNMAPLRWIPIGTFVVDPATIVSGDAVARKLKREDQD